MQQHPENARTAAQSAAADGVPHTLRLEERERLLIGGVTDVDSFDEETVKLMTTRGVLTVCGAGLHIEQLQLDTGDLRLAGRVDTLVYTDRATRRGKFGRLFR